MKLHMNLNFWDEKQNCHLTSLNYVIIIVFSVSCIKQKNYFIKNVFIFLAFTTCFHKDFCIWWRSSYRRWEIIFSRRMGLHCFKKHLNSTNFHGNRNKEQRNFSIVRKYGRNKKKQISIYPRTMNILSCKESKF